MSTGTDNGKMTYKGAGVDIHEAASFVGDIDELRARTEKKHQLYGAFGLFAAGFDLSRWTAPVLFTGCDGIGTKIEPLLEHDMPEAAGKDLVAMSVNDIITTGAEPIMFLDYLGVPKLDKAQLARFVAGMAEYLEDCGCILAGGETAEMPGLVPEDTIEMAGFCIGVAEKAEVIDPSTITEGDVLIGWRSDGFHANGWSLIRRVADKRGDLSAEEMRHLLAPTRLYHDVVEGMKAAGVTPRAYAHITGGGLPENLERVFPDKGADLQVPYWEDETVQKILEHVDPEDAPNTFNLGIGWVAIVAPEDVETTLTVGAGGVRLGEISAERGVRVTVASPT